MDVSSATEVASLVDDVVNEFNGRLDIFVANAGIPWTQGDFLDGDIEYYKRVMSIDLDSVYYCARAAGRHWRRQKAEGTTTHGRPLHRFTYGSFIATASMSGHIVNIPQLQASYNAAKAGVSHFGGSCLLASGHICTPTSLAMLLSAAMLMQETVRSIAVEMVRFARANTVSPGYISTAISDYVPPETKRIWNDKIPMGYVRPFFARSPVRRCV